MKKVIVTGILGQDGSWMADYLLNKGIEVYGVMRHYANPKLDNINHLKDRKGFHLIEGDLTDAYSVEALVKFVEPDYFINFAANSFVGCSWDMPEHVMDVNALGVLRCLEAIRKHAPKCRFYSAGSSEEFGDVQYSPQDEKHPLRPRSPYGASKASARHLVKVYRESYGLYAIQGWLFNHESERRGEEFVTRKITKGVARIKKELNLWESIKPIELGNLDASRDWSHSLDFCDGIWRMLNQEKYNSYLRYEIGNNLDSSIKEYVLSSNETHTVREFVELAFKEAGINGVWRDGISGKPEDEQFLLADEEHPTLTTKKAVPLVKINPKFYRPAEVNFLYGSSDLIRMDLGWNPVISFKELVERMVRNDIG